jgi:hypothetical protein
MGPIDIKKSIEKGKVVRKISILERIVNLFGLLVLMGIFPFCATANMLRANDENLYFAIALVLVSYSLSIAILNSFMNDDKLEKIAGISKEWNREVCRVAANKLGWEIIKDNADILVAKKYNSFKWDDSGKELVLIYKSNFILLNCVTYGRHNFKSPFHWFSSRKAERQIIEEIQKA